MRTLSRRTLLLAALGTGLTSACERRSEVDVQRLVLATGPVGATYRESGAALAKIWNEALGAPAVRTLSTEASVDNVRLLRRREVDLAYANVDVLREHHDRFSALLRIFDSVFHLVTLHDSGVRKLAELRGRRVALGLPSSGTRFTAERLLAVAGAEVESVDYGQQASARALLAGDVDAVMSLTAMPTPAVTWLLESRSRIRFVDLSAETRAIQRRYPGEYLPVTISSTVYPGASTTRTLAVPTLIAVRHAFPHDVARLLTKATVEGASALADTRPEAHQINARTAAATTPVALHPGAASWFRDSKP